MPVCKYKEALIESVNTISKMAFDEDSVTHDVTAVALPIHDKFAVGKIYTRDSVLFSGSLWLPAVFEVYNQYQNSDLHYEIVAQDGELCATGKKIITLEGRLKDILAIERTLLNFLGRGIGISSATASFKKALLQYGAHIQLLDTRKTLPAYRFFDKYSVLCGGGQNHRMSLGDRILLKENHQAFLTFKQKEGLIKEWQKSGEFYEMEVQSYEELIYALKYNCPHIMLDNFTPEQLKKVADVEKKNSKFEVSGGVHLDNIKSYCFDFIDYISVGALTHSVKTPDLTLLIE